MDIYLTFLEDSLKAMYLDAKYVPYVELSILLVALILFCVLANWIAKRVILKFVTSYVEKSINKWDDVLLEKRVFGNLSHLAPAIVIEYSKDIVFHNFTYILEYVGRFTELYIIVIIGITVLAFFNAIYSFLADSPIFKDKPIASFHQLLNIIIYLILGILVISKLINIEPGAILTGLGAATVVIMLVFKDTILGFVASIQIAANNMLRIGDWVEFKKYGADGTILHLNLTTVKVQNWDKTITTIPTYAFISDAFKNWRGMEESGGRRIKRSIFIDMNSIKFCSPETLNTFKKYHAITQYIIDAEKEISEFNKHNKIDTQTTVNGRRLTNIGVFRTYIENYLKDKSYINHNFTFLIRKLEATDRGVPIELYIFLNEQRWVEFEKIQDDIFDHLFAVLPEFDLRVFQSPSGNDFKKAL